MILKPNDIMQEGDALKVGQTKTIAIGKIWFGKQATELCNLSSDYLVERPDPTAEEIFSGIQAEAALRRISDTSPDFIIRKKEALIEQMKARIEKLAALLLESDKMRGRWHKAYTALFKTNEEHIKQLGIMSTYATLQQSLVKFHADMCDKANERIEEGDRQLDELAEIVSEQTDKIRYLEAMREPCLKRGKDDWDEEERSRVGIGTDQNGKCFLSFGGRTGPENERPAARLKIIEDDEGAIWPANQEDYEQSAREFSNRQNKRQEDKDTAWEHLRDARKEMLSDDEDSPASERAREAGWLGNYEHVTYCTED